MATARKENEVPVRDERVSLAAGLEDRLRRHVYFLASEVGERNTKAYEGLQKAARYIEETFSEVAPTSRQTYAVRGKECHNVQAEFLGSDRRDEILIVGAHYDSIRGGPGANDNASGVAAILALAQAFRGGDQGRTVRFVAFVNEEPPFTRTVRMGSHVYARQCKKREENIIGMLSLETIGCYAGDSDSQKAAPWYRRLAAFSNADYLAMISNVKSRDLVKKSATAFRNTIDFPLKSICLPGFLPGVKSSDQWSFWEHGYPGIMITDTAWVRYPFYHTSQDTAEKLDYCGFAEAVFGLEGVVRHLG